MSDYNAEFRRILDEELGDYSARVLELLAASIQAKDLVLSADLLKSLQRDVVAASAQHVATMEIAFNQYGRIREMKATTWGKAPPVEEIEKFVRKVGVGHFEYVPGYALGRKARATIPESRLVNRIAWGISRARKRDGVGPKPKAWFAKTFYKSLNSFIDAVTTRYAAQTGKHLAATIQF